MCTQRTTTNRNQINIYMYGIYRPPPHTVIAFFVALAYRPFEDHVLRAHVLRGRNWANDQIVTNAAILQRLIERDIDRELFP